MSLLADLHFSEGLRSPEYRYAEAQFHRAAELFPLNAKYRRGPANAGVAYRDQTTERELIPLMREGLATDPYSADLLSFLWNFGVWNGDQAAVDDAVNGFAKLPRK